MSPKRRHLEAVVAAFFIIVLFASGGTALYLVVTRNPVHTDPAAVPATAAEADAETFASAIAEGRRLARELTVRHDLPALSVAVAKDGQIVWAEGFGFANIERRVPVTPRTRFRTGSVSKTMTAAALALLHDRGHLDLDAPVQTYVPEYPKKQWTITPRQLMGDVAGVHRIRGDYNDINPRGRCKTFSDAMKMFDTEPLLFEPGTQYRFSNYGWILLSAVVEGAAAEPFATFMKREVFAPLGMDRTMLEEASSRPGQGSGHGSDDVSFYRKRRTFGFYQGPTDAIDNSYACFFGAGAFLSTPSDLVRLGSAMMVPKPDTAARGLLKPQTITLFQTPLTLKSGESTGFALGWRVDTLQLTGMPTRVVRHRATTFGGTATLSLFPELGLAVAAMANGNDEMVDPFALQVAEAFTGRNAWTGSSGLK